METGDGVLRVVCSAIALVALVGGCRTGRQVRDREYAEVLYAANQAAYDAAPGTSSVSPVAHDLEGPHDVRDYIAVALGQNPEVHAARKQLEAIAHQVPVAASLQDPTLSVTALPSPVQTASGQQELLMTASQKTPWFGKLDTRAEVARAEANMARARLAAVELATIEKVKRPYYELYFLQQAIRATEAEQNLLKDIRKIAETRYKSGGTSQQDVLRADLEVSNVESELIRMRQQLDSAQARLASVLHVGPRTRVRALDRLPDERLAGDLDRLQRLAVAARPELHAQLAALSRDRRKTELARLEYMPDLTFSATWIDVAGAGVSPVANGRDAVLVGTSVNLPIYRKRLDAAVRSAEAQAVATARQYDSLRDATLEEVMDLFVRAKSEQELLVLFREDILPRARQTLEVSSRAYNVGEVDFLQLIDNWRALLRYEVAYYRHEATLRQTLASLERVVGGFDATAAAGEAEAAGEPGAADASAAPRENLQPMFE